MDALEGGEVLAVIIGAHNQNACRLIEEESDSRVAERRPLINDLICRKNHHIG